jgi:hypothetical protein
MPLLESLRDGAAAVPSLVRITGDRAYASAYLGALPDDPCRCPIGPVHLGDHGAEPRADERLPARTR